MSATFTNAPVSHPGPFARAENWLDSKGKGAWIAATILSLIFVWPVGLALLIYMIWSKRLFSRSPGNGIACRAAFSSMRPSGNQAFDAYKAETLRRLEDEQRAFEEFLERLREAKDKAEFDQFMENREARSNDVTVQDEKGESPAA